MRKALPLESQLLWRRKAEDPLQLAHIDGGLATRARHIVGIADLSARLFGRDGPDFDPDGEKVHCGFQVVTSGEAPQGTFPSG